MIPTDLSGCMVWIDASQLGLTDGQSLGSTWPDLSGGNNHGVVVGSPAPVVKTNAPNGKPVVRFAASEGRIRGDGMCVDSSIPLTVMYVGRMWGSNVGRIFSNTYPPYNFLVGTHTGGEPRMYDNGWGDSNSGWPALPSAWKTYGVVCTDTPSTLSTFYVNGAVDGSTTTSVGHDSLWNISGYEATGTGETCDCEVAELVCYNRKLSDSERESVEDYLYAKWFEEEPPPEVNANLVGAGQLSVTIEPKYALTVGLMSTGQLDGSITEIEEESPPYLGGWTDDPNPLPPQRRSGIGWFTGITAIPPKTGGGWFALLEKVGQHNGLGTLSAVPAPRLFTKVDFGGHGVLSPELLLHRDSEAVLSSVGSLVGDMFEYKILPETFFTGSGEYEALSINDGLSATTQIGYGVNFIGGGELTPNVVGGVQYSDGLSALAWESYLYPAHFTGVGQLLGFAGEISIALANLIGSGVLTTDTKQIYSLVEQLAGNGTLSAPAFAAYQKLVNLLGTGQLSAPAFASYLKSVGFSGAGALTALLVASYQQASAGSGVGTITAIAFARYTVPVTFSGGGSLSATAVPLIPQEFVNADFSGAGVSSAIVLTDGLSATVYGQYP